MGLGDFDGHINRNLIIGFLRLLFVLAPMCSILFIRDSRKVSNCGKCLSKLQTHGDTNILLFRLYELVVSNNLLRLSTVALVGGGGLGRDPFQPRSGYL